MTDDTPKTSTGPTGEDSPAPAPSAAGAGGASLPERAALLANDRPEVAVGAAFGGGLLLALILKRLGS